MKLLSAADKTMVFEERDDNLCCKAGILSQPFKEPFQFYKEQMTVFQSYPTAINEALQLPQSCPHINNPTWRYKFLIPNIISWLCFSA